MHNSNNNINFVGRIKTATIMVKKQYPLGIQTFEEIITNNLLYIDKTEYIYRMSHSGGKHMEKKQLEEYLGYRLEEEKKWGITNPAKGNNNRLINLINTIYRGHEHSFRRNLTEAIRCSLENFGEFEYVDKEDQDAIRHVRILPLYALALL